MPARACYRVLLKQTPTKSAVCITFPGVPELEFRDRIARLAGYLWVLSDAEFKQFGLALLAAVAGHSSGHLGTPRRTKCPDDRGGRPAPPPRHESGPGTAGAVPPQGEGRCAPCGRL